MFRGLFWISGACEFQERHLVKEPLSVTRMQNIKRDGAGKSWKNLPSSQSPFLPSLALPS